MDFITEQALDEAADHLIEPGILDEVLAELADEQPWLLTFLTADAGPVLSPDERDHMMFLALVIWHALDINARVNLPQIQPEQLELADEAIWTHLQASGNRSFREMLDPFFAETTQEDVLAFIEDSLQTDEDSPVTAVGREPIFVRLKVMIDLICES